MERLDRRTWILLAGGGLILVLAAFVVGRWTAPSEADVAAAADSSDVSQEPSTSDASGDEQVGGTTSSTSLVSADPSAALVAEDPDRPEQLPTYGSEADRESLILGLAEAGYAMSSRSTMLWVADSVCYDLERLSAQGRSPAFAVRVVWNETLGDLASGDAAAFGAVFSAATAYLCPHMGPYGEDVAYWLGY